MALLKRSFASNYLFSIFLFHRYFSLLMYELLSGLRFIFVHEFVMLEFMHAVNRFGKLQLSTSLHDFRIHFLDDTVKVCISSGVDFFIDNVIKFVGIIASIFVSYRGKNHDCITISIYT